MPKVKSSNLEAVVYDATKKKLSIKFHNSPTLYIYSNVSKQRYDNLMAAPSKGIYFHTHIRNQYPFIRKG